VLRPSEIAKFLLRFTLLYALSIALWPTVGPTYGESYRSAVQTIIRLGDRDHRVVVRASRIPFDKLVGAALDTEIVCRMPDKGRKGTVRELISDRSSRYSGYAPLALTLALILATPLPWKRRAEAAFWGALLATWFAVLVPAFQIYPLYLREENHWLFGSIPSLFPIWHTFVFTLSKMTRWVTLYYIIPFLIWITLSFRIDEVSAIVERLAASVKPATSDTD